MTTPLQKSRELSFCVLQFHLGILYSAQSPSVVSVPVLTNVPLSKSLRCFVLFDGGWAERACPLCVLFGTVTSGIRVAHAPISFTALSSALERLSF